MRLRVLGFSVPKTLLKIVLLSIATEFKVEGGCKVKVEYNNDYRRVWIITADGKHKFAVTRLKRGGKFFFKCAILLQLHCLSNILHFDLKDIKFLMAIGRLDRTKLTLR